MPDRDPNVRPPGGPEPDPDSLLGKSLGHFQIVDEIGRGGMGIVYRARDERLHRDVALKVLGRDLTASDERRRRLIREARVLARIEHPNVARIYELDESDGQPFVAMELVRGRPLRQRLQEGPLSGDEAARIALDVCRGLQAAHALSIAHRDLKPENVVLAEDGGVKILDFGLAKLLEEETVEEAGESETTASVLLSRPGRIAGTLPYMSPEQLRGEPVDARSDIFSFGVMLYEMLSGSRPFEGDSTPELISAILTRPAPSLSGTRRELSARFDPVIDRCLAKEPGDRFQTVEELVAALTSSRRRRSAIGPAVAIAGLFGLLVAGWLGWRLMSGPGEPEAGPDDRLRVVVAPFSVVGASAGDDAGRIVQSLVERGLRDLGDDVPVQLLEGRILEPLVDESAARAAGEREKADIVCWGELLHAGGDAETEVRLTLLRPLDEFDPYGDDLDLVPQTAGFLESVRRIRLDASGELDAWRTSADDVTGLVTTLAALSLYRQGEFDRAAEILAAQHDPTPDQRFYHGLALLRSGNPLQAGPVLRRVLEDDPDHVGAQVALWAAQPTGPVHDFDVVFEALRRNPFDERVNAGLMLAAVTHLVTGSLSERAEEIEAHFRVLCEGPADRELPTAVKKLAVASAFQLGMTGLANGSDEPGFLRSSFDCPAFQETIESDPPLHASICHLTKSVSWTLPRACIGWEPDPHEISPVLYAAMKYGTENLGDLPGAEILTLAQSDERPLATRVLWSMLMEKEVALRWLRDEVRPESQEIGLYRLTVARLLLLLGRPAEAREELDRVVEITGDTTEIRLDMAISLIAEERFDDAIETLGETSPQERSLALAATGRTCEVYEALRPPNLDELLQICGIIQRHEGVHDALVARNRQAAVDAARDPRRNYEYGFEFSMAHPEPVWREKFDLRLETSLPRDPLALIEAVRQLGGDPPAVARNELDATLQDLSQATRSLARSRDRETSTTPADWQREANAHDSLGELEQAEAVIRRALDSEPDHVWGLSRLADLSERHGRLDDAEEIRSRLVELDPEDPERQFNLGRLLAQSGRFAEAEVRFRRTAELRPRLTWAWSELAWTLVMQGDYPGAEDAATRAIALDPDNSAAHFQLGRSFRFQDRLDDAATEYLRARELNPDWHWTHHELGLVRRQQGRLEEAIPHFRKAVELGAGEVAIWSDLAAALLETRACDEAATGYAKLIDLGSKTADADRKLGDCHWQLARYEEAARSYGRSLELDPGNGAVRYARGRALSRSGQHTEAIEAFEETLEVGGPHRHDVLVSIGHTWRLAGEPGKAVPLLEQAAVEAERDHGPEHNGVTNALTLLVTVLAENGRTVEARPAAERLLDLLRRIASKEDASASAKNKLAWALLYIELEDLRNPDEALPVALKASEMHDYQNASHVHTLAHAYYRIGKRTEAIETLDRALRLLPADSPSRREFEEDLETFRGEEP